MTGACKWMWRSTQAMSVPASQVLSQEDLTLSVFSGCDRQLSSVHSYKYLGVVLDSKLTWAPHMEHLIRKVSSKIGVLYRSSKKLSTDAKRQYYLSVIQSDLAYGSTRSIHHFHNQQKNTSPDSARGGCVPFSARPHGLTQNLSLEKWNFVPSTYASSLNFSYTPIDAHTHLPVLYFVNSTNLDLIQTAHTAPLVLS